MRYFSILAGNKYMDAQGIPYLTEWDLWSNIIALVAMIIILQIFCYYKLIRIKIYSWIWPPSL